MHCLRSRLHWIQWGLLPSRQAHSWAVEHLKHLSLLSGMNPQWTQNFKHIQKCCPCLPLLSIYRASTSLQVCSLEKGRFASGAPTLFYKLLRWQDTCQLATSWTSHLVTALSIMTACHQFRTFVQPGAKCSVATQVRAKFSPNVHVLPQRHPEQHLVLQKSNLCFHFPLRTHSDATDCLRRN